MQCLAICDLSHTSFSPDDVLVGIDKVEECLHCWIRTLIGELDGMLDFLVHLFLDLLKARIINDACRFQALGKGGDGVMSSAFCPDLLLVAVAVGIDH